MQQATDSAAVESKLVQSVVASTNLAENDVRIGVAWVDKAMLFSPFNMYYELNKVIGYIRLAITVSPEDLAFSLEVHHFQPLPPGYPIDRILPVISATLANEGALREYVDNLPTD